MKNFLFKFLLTWVLTIVFPLLWVEMLYEGTQAPVVAEKVLLWPPVIAAIGVIAFVAVGIETLCKLKRDAKEADVFTGEEGDEIKTETGLKYKDLKVGDGQEAKTGNHVAVHYTGWLTDGTKFDSSRDRKEETWQTILGGMSPRFPLPPQVGPRPKVDKNADRKEPLSFQIDNDHAGHSVIQGWHQGVASMKVGGRRKLIVPPELAYAKKGFPPHVPPDAAVIFEVELLTVA